MKLLTLLVSVFLCAPGAAQWSVESLSLGRFNLGAASAGSKALFAGGRPNNASGRIDVYDTATGTWSTASLTSSSGDVRGASARDRALFMGDYTTTVDVFDGSTGLWSTTVAPTAIAGFHAGTGAGDKVLFGGGAAASGTGYNAVVNVYDTLTGAWSTELLSQGRGGLAATGVGDLALFAGGRISCCTVLATVNIFDTTTGTWTTAALSEPRGELAATSVAGKALFAGGRDSGATFSSRVDLFDAATNTWTTAALSEPRGELAATSAGRFAIFAGGFRNDPMPRSDRVDVYDSLTGTWSTASLSEPRSLLAATSVGGTAFFGGGAPSYTTYSAVVDVFDVEPGTAFCAPAVPNSTGLGALLRAEGSTLIADDDLTLIATQLPPGQFGYFLTSRTQGLIQPPGSQGPICLSGNIGRFNRPGEIIQGPVGSLRLDLASLPVNPPVAAAPGDTWSFQCWYRDVNPGPTSNTTNGIALTFATGGDPAVQFPVTRADVVEDATRVEVRVTLSQAVDHDVLVGWVTGGSATLNVDWRVEEANPFVIPAGRFWADMTLIVAEDAAQESDETATVSLLAPVGSVPGTATDFILTIVDDD